MIRLRQRIREYETRERPDYEVETMDVLRRVVAAAGYIASDGDLEEAWLEYSDSMCAGWMDHRGYSDAVLLAIVLKTLEPDE